MCGKLLTYSMHCLILGIARCMPMETQIGSPAVDIASTPLVLTTALPTYAAISPEPTVVPITSTPMTTTTALPIDTPPVCAWFFACAICFTWAVFSIGYLVSNVFPVFARTPGFLSSNTAWGHVSVGVLLGVAVWPCLGEVIWFIVARQLCGFVIFAAYTIRNYNKHTNKNKKVLATCGMSDEYSCSRSSVSKQQMQLGFGMGCSFMVYAFIRPDMNMELCAIPCCSLASCILLRGIVQLFLHHDASETFRAKVKKYRESKNPLLLR